MALGEKCLQVVDGMRFKVFFQHIKTQFNIVVAVFFTQLEVFFHRGIFLTGGLIISEFQHIAFSFIVHRALRARPVLS